MNNNHSHQYKNHRANQRELILNTAEKLFTESGIDRVSMSDIARTTGITRKTLYAYFSAKQEIAWQILISIFEENRKNTPEFKGNGYQKIEQLMFSMMRLLETHPEHARFIVEFDSLYAREVNADRMRQVTRRAQQATPFLATFITEGIEDGSLRPDLDPSLVSAAIWNLLSGMNSRFALLGELIKHEFGQPSTTIYQEICRCFLQGIKSKPDTKENKDE